MGLFQALFGSDPKEETKPVSTKERKLKTETFYVVGTSYYTRNLKRLAMVNPDWKLKAEQLIADDKAGQKIFHYNYTNKPAKLIPEPTNKHDKNAVKAVIAGETVGYISRDDNRKVLRILKQHEIKYISALITGGEYKIVSQNGETCELEKQISINMKIGYV